MSKAPEWIYLDGDVEAGDGMFARSFENPKYASEPQVEYVRVDLAEAAEQQGYASAMEDARKLHEARIEELEAKLAKAVEGFEELARLGNGDRYGNSFGNLIAQKYIAELTGGKDA